MSREDISLLLPWVDYWALFNWTLWSRKCILTFVIHGDWNHQLWGHTKIFHPHFYFVSRVKWSTCMCLSALFVSTLFFVLFHRKLGPFCCAYESTGLNLLLWPFWSFGPLVCQMLPRFTNNFNLVHVASWDLAKVHLDFCSFQITCLGEFLKSKIFRSKNPGWFWCSTSDKLTWTRVTFDLSNFHQRLNCSHSSHAGCLRFLSLAGQWFNWLQLARLLQFIPVRREV